MENPPKKLLAQYQPPDRSSSYVRSMITMALEMGLELDDNQLGVACAWFLSHPDLGMRYLHELKNKQG